MAGIDWLTQLCGLLAWMLLGKGRFTESTKHEHSTATRKDSAFLPDKEVGSTLFYRIVTLFSYHWARFFHRYEIKGLDKLPREGEGQGALFVSMHTTHNQDIPMMMTGLYAKTGRALRALIHRQVYRLNPYAKYVGAVPGNRATAVQLLQQGFFAACLPGGSEEAMTGHENAYRLHARWGDRRGYAHVAKDAGVKIYPVFTENVEEMRFNPIFWLANKYKVGKVFDSIVSIPMIGWVVKQLGMLIWFVLAPLSIPMPVKLTTIIGDPIETEGYSVDEIAVSTHSALQNLIDSRQPHGHAYRPGLESRLAKL